VGVALAHMSVLTYTGRCVTTKPLVWLHGEVKTPPFSAKARAEAGYLLRLLQEGDRLGLPESRPMPGIGPNCHELRVVDEKVTWRILYAVRTDAVVILEVFEKKTRKTPQHVIDVAKLRLKKYLTEAEED
jgi:phage-related protein